MAESKVAAAKEGVRQAEMRYDSVKSKDQESPETGSLDSTWRLAELELARRELGLALFGHEIALKALDLAITNENLRSEPVELERSSSSFSRGENLQSWAGDSQSCTQVKPRN